MMKNSNKLVKKGFTLVELIVAMSITSILILVIIAMTGKGVDIWKSVFQQVNAMEDSRAALDKLSMDLESMQVRAGNNFEWLLSERDKDLLLKTPDMGPDVMPFANASRLIFFTVATDRNPAMTSSAAATYNADMRSRRATMGDVNCVGYKLVFKDQILNLGPEKDIGFPIYALYRNIIPAHHTFDDILGKKDLYLAYKKYESSELALENFLAENIIEMTLNYEVKVQTRRGSTKDDKNFELTTEVVQVPIVATNVARNGYRRLSLYGDRLRVEQEGSVNATMEAGEVLGVTISLTVVTDEGMAILNKARKGVGGVSIPRKEVFFSKYTRQYTQFIKLPKPN